MTMADLLAIRDLRVSFMTEEGVAQAVDGIDLAIAPGETLAVVGESGCGRTDGRSTPSAAPRSP